MCFTIRLCFINFRLIAFIFYIVAQADPSYAVYNSGSTTVEKVGLWSVNWRENCDGNNSCDKNKAARAFFVISTIAACKWNRISAIACSSYFFLCITFSCGWCFISLYCVASNVSKSFIFCGSGAR